MPSKSRSTSTSQTPSSSTSRLTAKRCLRAFPTIFSSTILTAITIKFRSAHSKILIWLWIPKRLLPSKRYSSEKSTNSLIFKQVLRVHKIQKSNKPLQRQILPLRTTAKTSKSSTFLSKISRKERINCMLKRWRSIWEMLRIHWFKTWWKKKKSKLKLKHVCIWGIWQTMW